VLDAFVPSAFILVVQLTGAAPRILLVPSTVVPSLAEVVPAMLLPIEESLFIGVVLHAASVNAITPPRIMLGIVDFMLCSRSRLYVFIMYRNLVTTHRCTTPACVGENMTTFRPGITPWSGKKIFPAISDRRIDTSAGATRKMSMAGKRCSQKQKKALRFLVTP
jgi:hypothetical protein